MSSGGFPRAVLLGGGAGTLRILMGLAAHLRNGDHERQRDLLTAVVPCAADVEEAGSLVGGRACVLPATVDAGPVARANPETVRRLINAEIIIAAPADLAHELMPILKVGGIAATLAAVTAPRVYVADAIGIAPLLPIYRRPPGLASCFDRVLVDPDAAADGRALARALLRLVRPELDEPPAAPR
jgi:2-phospho-L-lactate transferase/gluconeogenesis factor (CofD/UPF0052 family)